MAGDLQWAADNDSRRCLRSASSHKLVVRHSRLNTNADRFFGVAATRLWSGLPLNVTAAVFNGLKNTHLFRDSYLTHRFKLVTALEALAYGRLNLSYMIMSVALLDSAERIG